MNYEICRNCEYYKTCGIYVNHRNKCVPKYCKSLLYARLIAEQLKEDVRPVFFKLLDLGKRNDCPFAVEHNIGDWNGSMKRGSIKEITENLRLVSREKVFDDHKKVILDILAGPLVKILNNI